MQLDSDIALFGTGIAPLVAANHLLIQGKSVLLLNPDRDFFLEDSELPLDPLIGELPTLARLQRNSPERALAELRPDFPGAIEFWTRGNKPSGFHDPDAPHVRQRSRLWISNHDKNRFWNWERLEDLYVETSDAGLNPQILEGITASRRFPGLSEPNPHLKGLYIPKLSDVDTYRYRNGLLEFVRERLGNERVLCGVNQLETMPEGIRFHSKGALHTAKLKLGMLVFWTPRLSPWIIHQTKKAEVKPHVPKGIRYWEQWSINSREAPDPSVVGMFDDMAVWADFEGQPNLPPQQGDQETLNIPRLAVLRAGPLVPLGGKNSKTALNWGSAESFGSLTSLCQGFLKWDRFSIRSLRARAVFEWDHEEPWLLSQYGPPIRVIPACDGPLVDVVRVARKACDPLLLES